MKLIFAYEHADWHNTSIIMVRNNIDIDDLTQAFLDSLHWYRNLLDAIEEEVDADAALAENDADPAEDEE